MIFCKLDYKYQPFFCEENIWWLGKSLQVKGLSLEKQYALFFSNDKQQIPLFFQDQGEGLVVWDYHVVLYYKDEISMIFDFNTLLPFPCNAQHYCAYTFPKKLPKEHQIYTRQIPMKDYHQKFYSDRSHMLDKNQKPLQPFPNWPAITGKKPHYTLDEYVDFKQQKISKVLPLDKFFTNLQITI
ncbi:hypothetical protein [Candidatus Uabimicrobium sp. HlEnr_7]|uniref:hypothetical protein n=1 Tax=Candidatus Uabimicrobium helgolandensis TaxID=3095367 RepID=UPI003558F109